jgi:diguanylate cyclase (GGDEF)-like protein
MGATVRGGRNCLVLTIRILVLVIALTALSLAAEQSSGEIAELLEEIREVSYTRHWHEAQEMLDEIADRVDGFPLRQQFEFYLLEARHLSLGDDNPKALERVIRLLDLPLDPDQYLRALQFAANVAVLLREYEIAYEYLLDALGIESEIEDPEAVIDTYNMAGYMFGRVGEYERAVGYGERAVTLAVERGDRNRECVARQRLAPVFKWGDMPVEAEREYRTGIEVCERIGNRLFVGVLKHGLADQLRKLGRLEEARELAESSIELLAESDFVLGEYEARLVLAEVLHDQGDEEAWQAQDVDGLVAYFGERELWDQRARLEYLLSRNAASAGNSDAALEHLDRHLEARERFLGRDRAMLLGYLQVEFDSRLKDQQIELLAESARLARMEQLAAEQERRSRTAILALSSGLLVMVGLLLIAALRGRRHFRYLARHDPLSGLANQGWFLQCSEELLETARQTGSGACLITADIDHFKRINDHYGHLVGDGVIGQAARRFRESFGEDALVGRVGGEEFSILMLTDSVDEVIARVEQFRQGEVHGGRTGDPEFTVSFGLAFLRPGDSLSDLRARADQALYEAKRTGRDRYVIQQAVGASA